ncbi:MAG: hypothetical protein KBA81_01275 [Rhabdochlamydiaceae bacterium]|nr:hypothetical protein [Rhabdochlamydiaceae bacterium]
MFINPLNLVTYLAKTGGSAAFTKLREHFHLTNKDLKEHATAKNIAYGTFAATAVAAALIHPTSRTMLCTLLGLTYTMSTITLNLMMIGLYLGWMGMKGAGSIFTKVSEGLSGLSQGKNPSSGNTPPSAPTESENPKPPAKSVEQLGQEMADEFLQERAKEEAAKKSGQEMTDEYFEQKDIEKTSQPKGEQVSEFDNMDKAWNESQRKSEFSPEELDDIFNELSEQKNMEKAFQDSEKASKSPKQIEEPSTKSPRSDTTSVQKPMDNSWADEFVGKTRKLPQFNVGEFLQFNNQIRGDEWAGEFVREQAQRRVPNLGKIAVGALAVGVGVFAVAKIYQALKEADQDDYVSVETSYASVSSNQFPTGTNGCYGLTENPLF